MEKDTCECIFTKLTTLCDDLDYQAFGYLERVVWLLPDSELKKLIEENSESNKKNRIRNFLIGDWKWQSDDDVKTRICVVVNKDNLLREVTQVRAKEMEYQIGR